MDLEVLEKWCQDGITMLSSPEDIPHLVELRRKLVTHFSRSPKLYELASDISEDLSDLPEDARRIAREYLISTYGFSFEFFMDRKLAKVREILKRGKIRSAAEFRALSDFAADVEVEEGLARDAELLLASYSKA
ncbi:hypothetical protein NJH49_10655 [Stenotrophomonas maltophilia]|uniref:Uncharacterized protein n=2 Tax=Stenotrophomonas maltophilia TaxID=40324 RepID=A0AAP7GSC7_STEMA|nr:hypothetical protein [Stenotrophomonas maltophilia]MCO7397443.1 hypothetical protein [Stenotrophomonas maltophilia]MCO7411843.1 hypothetical protein [Stenotrophomonas maltophilia]OBU61604.1 hypothetical protein A9K56_09910 [Stenotrophomonas maltophilia]